MNTPRIPTIATIFSAKLPMMCLLAALLGGISTAGVYVIMKQPWAEPPRDVAQVIYQPPGKLVPPPRGTVNTTNGSPGEALEQIAASARINREGRFSSSWMITRWISPSSRSPERPASTSLPVRMTWRGGFP